MSQCVYCLIAVNTMTCRTIIKNGVKKTEVYENDHLVHRSEESAPDTLTNRSDGGQFIKYKY